MRTPWFTLLVGGVVAAGFCLAGAAPPALVWTRDALEAGEIWRLITGHLVHTDLAHLGWNLGAYLILGGVLESVFGLNARRQIGLLAVSMLLVGAGVSACRPDIAVYAGLSGVLNAYFLVLLQEAWSRNRSPLAPLALIGVLGKTTLEIAQGDTVLGASVWQAVSEAHAAGLIAGAVWLGLERWRGGPLPPRPAHV